VEKSKQGDEDANEAETVSIPLNNVELNKKEINKMGWLGGYYLGLLLGVFIGAIIWSPR